MQGPFPAPSHAFGRSPGKPIDIYLSVVVRDRPDATVVTVSGELDVASSPRLRAALDRVNPTPARRVVLDLAELSFIDVTGLSLLLRAQQRARRLRSRLVLVNVPDAVRRLLRLTGSTDLLDSIQEG